MISLLTGNNNYRSYHLYNSGNTHLRKSTFAEPININHLSRQISSLMWGFIRYHFYHDLDYFELYFRLIKRPTSSILLCRVLQGCSLLLAVYFIGLWLCSPLLPRWVHLVGADVFYLLGVTPTNYLWMVTCLSVAHRLTGLLLTGNTGSTSVVLCRILVQQDSGDFVHPLVASLAATTENAHFKKYLPYEQTTIKRKWWWKKQKLGKSRHFETTWAQYCQAFAIRLRNVLQIFLFLSDLYLLNILYQFTTELMSIFSGLDFAFWYAIFLVIGSFAYLLGYALYEVLTLFATLGATLGLAYYVLLEQMAALIGLQTKQKLKLKSTNNGRTRVVLSERTFFAFRFYISRCIDYVGDYNEIYGRALAFYYLFCYPCNAAIVVTLIFRPIDWFYVTSAGVLTFYQLAFMFGGHLYAARMTAKLHRPARWLIGAEVDVEKYIGNKKEVGKLREAKRTWERFRVQLQLANYIAHFHTDHQYAITYGKAGNVTFRSFTRSIFYYLKFFIFAVKIYFEY